VLFVSIGRVVSFVGRAGVSRVIRMSFGCVIRYRHVVTICRMLPAIVQADVLGCEYVKGRVRTAAGREEDILEARWA
jgi:hypothetical protein